MIDSIYILSLEHDKLRRQRLLNLLHGESDKSLAGKAKIVRGVHHPKIDENFLSSNKMDYYKGWALSDKEIYSILSKHNAEDQIRAGGSAEYFWARPLQKGQLASLIGHSECWKQIVLNNDEYAIIFEDDAWWEGCLTSLIDEVSSLDIEFDICFLGRIALISSEEKQLESNSSFCSAKYSYNNHAYILSRQGALKALSQNPHKNLMSSDEFLPSCYDYHPRPDVRKKIKKCMKAIGLTKKNKFTQQNIVYNVDHSFCTQFVTEEEESQGITITNIHESETIE